MVDITQEVQNELDSILETYSGSRLPNENGASAFQNWWWQVQTHIQNLDKSQLDTPDGVNLPYEIPYWGDMKYSKYTIGQDIFILVTYIKFNEANFFQFIKYHRYSKKGEPIIVGNLNFNYKLIKVPRSRLYGIMTPYDEVLIKPCYDRIIPFYHCSENFNRIHAIGIKNGRCYAIDLDGNTEKLSMNANELMSIGCRHHHDLDESKLKKKIIIENNNTTNKFRNMNNKKVVRLTESQLHNIIAESVSQILNEVGYKSYHKGAVGADKRLRQKFPDAFNPFSKDKSFRDNAEFQELSKKKIDFLNARDDDFMDNNPGVRKGKYNNDPYKVTSKVNIPNSFRFDFNNGKNTMEADYGRPTWAYYSDDPDAYDERWNEKRIGKGKKPMTPDEEEIYNRVKRTLRPFD